MLRFRSSPDFEVPHDDNLDNVYTITVRASDGRLATSVHVTVTVADVNERPVADLAITDQTMTVGVSRIISLQGTFSDPDTNDTLTYTASTSPSGIATASVSNSDSTLTIAALSAGSATITVRDDDAPPVPTGLSANGNIVNGEASIWWEASTGATAYDLRYAVETCTDTPQLTASECTPGAWTEENGIAGTNTKLSAGTGSSTQLDPSVVYRLQVRGTNNVHDRSAWSAPAFIYPTDNPPAARLSGPVGAGTSKPPLIATAPLYGHHEHQGSAVFRFGICDGTIPSGVNLDADDIEAAIEKWEQAVKKDGSGNSLIETTRYEFPPAPEPLPPPGSPSQPSPPPLECRPPVGPFPTGHNAVIFAGDWAMDRALCLGDTTPACWRSSTWDWVKARAEAGLVGRLPSIAEGTILLRETLTKGGRLERPGPRRRLHISGAYLDARSGTRPGDRLASQRSSEESCPFDHEQRLHP